MPGCVDELLHFRHYSLFAPRDFDVSPYFEIVKPTLRDDFDYRQRCAGARPAIEAARTGVDRSGR